MFPTILINWCGFHVWLSNENEIKTKTQSGLLIDYFHLRFFCIERQEIFTNAVYTSWLFSFAPFWLVYLHVKLNFKYISLNTFFSKTTFSFAIFTLKKYKGFSKFKKEKSFRRVFQFCYSEIICLAKFASTGVIAGVHTLL